MPQIGYAGHVSFCFLNSGIISTGIINYSSDLLEKFSILWVVFSYFYWFAQTFILGFKNFV